MSNTSSYHLFAIILFLIIISSFGLGYPSSGEICGDGIDNNFDAQIDEDCNRIIQPGETTSESALDELYDEYGKSGSTPSNSFRNYQNTSESSQVDSSIPAESSSQLENTSQSESLMPGQFLDAGADQEVTENSNVTLVGRFNGPLNKTLAHYSWRQVSGAHNISLVNTNSSNLNFTAPSLESGLDVLGFELSLTDNSGKIYKDGIEVLVKAIE